METFQIIVFVIFGGVSVLFLACALYFNVMDKSEKTGKEDTPSKFIGKLILAIIIVLVCFFLISMCGGDGAPWQPRHT